VTATHIARVISVLLHPAILQSLFIFFPIGYPTIDTLVIAQVVLITAVLPLVLSGIYLKWIQVENIFTIPRKNRMIPFGISLLCLSIAWYLYLDPYAWMGERILFVLILNGIAFLFTQWEKLSLHVFAICSVSILWLPNWQGSILLLLPLILWARIQLKAHSNFQLWLGAIVGVVAALILQAWH
jgi:hypothetical protein